MAAVLSGIRQLSVAQRAIFVASLLDANSAAFNLGGYADIVGALDVGLFREAVTQAVRATDALRAHLIDRDGEVLQAIASDPDLVAEVRFLDLSAEDDPEAAKRDSIRQSIDTPLDVKAPCLFKAALLRLASERHTFFFCCHHICMDGASVFIFVRAIADAYTALARGDLTWSPPYGSLLPALDREAAYRDSPRFERDRTFWRDQLNGILDVEALGRTARAIVRGPRETVTVPASLERALSAVSEDGHVTFAAVAIASVAIHLSLVGGERSVVLSVPVSGRSGRFAQTPGMLSNIFPLRVEVPPGVSFAAIAAAVAQEMAAAMRHHRYRLEDMRDGHAAWRRIGGLPGPLVNIMAFEDVLDFAGASGVARSISNGPTDDLSFLFFKRGAAQDFEIGIDANPSRRNAAEHRAHAAAYARTIVALAKAPAEPVAVVAARLCESRDGAPEGVNDTAGPEVRAALHVLVERQVRATPEAPAILFREEAVSYGELDRRANRLAHLLMADGIGPERIVAVALPRSVELVVTLLAVLKAGAAYLPLDLDHPPQRLALMIEDARPACVIALSAAAERLGVGAPCIRLDNPDRQAALAAAPDRSPDRADAVGRDTPAYVIYTSGSTGRPKGVVVGHAAIVNRLVWMQAAYGLTARDRVLQKTSAGFDVSVWEFFWPLITGAALVVAEPGGHKDPGYLVDVVNAMGVTTMHFVPSALQQFLLHPRAGTCTGLRHVVCSGEALTAKHRDQFLRTLGARLHNLYGPTEAAVDVTAWECAAGQHPDRVPIGRPIRNTVVRVLNRGLRPVPAGMPGELFLAGVCLARGYLDRPSLTAERFLPDPAGPPGARMYRTGDIVRWDEDGQLLYLGRQDEQLKIRGFRIEPGEIEAALRRAPVVAQAVVIAREGPQGDLRLVAYTSPVAGAAINPDALRASLARTLPDHMVPAAIVAMPTLPIGPNGKLDRSALPAPTFAGSDAEPPHDPRTDLVAAIMADLLGLDSVGASDNFFDLGGHSLLAMRLAVRLGAAFGVEIPVRLIFEATTATGLAGSLDRCGAARAPVEAGPRPERLPLSSAQSRLWFLHRLEGPSGKYNIPIALDLRGPLDAAALESALDDVVARHEVLRTVYALHDGVGNQRVLPGSAGASLRTVEIPPEHRDATLRRLCAEGFDLDREIPLRAALLRLAPDHHVLALVLHHIAADGWSLLPLARDVATAYAARTGGSAPAWHPLAIQYADYALWEHARIGDEAQAGSLFAAQSSYWKRQLADAPERISLPRRLDRADVAELAGGSLAFEIAAELHAGLARIAAASDATVFMALLAGFATVLNRLGAGTDLVVGTPVAGRKDAALDPLVGCFVNMLALRLDLSGRPSFRGLLARARAVSLDAHDNADLPFERVVAQAGPSRSAARHPVFQVVLALQTDAAAGIDLLGVETRLVPVPLGVHKYDLSLDAVARRGAQGRPAGLQIRLEFAADVLDAAGAQRVAADLVKVLTDAVAAPDDPVAWIERLDETERSRVLVAWNDTRRSLAPETMAQLFARQAARVPDAVAVVAGADTLTYAELDAWAERIATVLAGRGLGLEGVVGVALPRSPALIAGLLGVLKAGAAYLPLDPSYPADRIAWMIADAAPACLLAEPAFAGAFGTDLDCVSAAEIEALRHAGAEGSARRAALPSNAAYVIYTSGSTGRPKGTVVPHRGVAAMVQSQIERFAVTPEARVLQFASISFDAAFFETCMALLSGARLVLAPEERRLMLDRLPAFIRDHGVTHATLPPSLLAQWSPGDLDGCPWLIVAGETCPGPLARAWSARHNMVNAYGPTETTVWATASDPLRGDEAPTIGRPILDTQAYILDEEYRPVPWGVEGELFLASAGLARGYLGRPGLTAESFVPHPFGTAGERLYRTGDRARHRKDGRIAFLGRRDGQIKLRGFRVELEEIAETLRRQPDVREATVLALPTEDGATDDLDLVAYAAGPADPARAALLAALRVALPGHMVPRHLVLLDRLPVTPNGKLDAAALPRPETAPGTADGATVDGDCATPTERSVAAIWESVLKTAGLDRASDFFALGGHSLSAMQVVSRVRDLYGVNVPLRVLFEAPKLADFARAVECAPRLCDIGRSTVLPPGRLPLSYAQRRLWLLDRIEGNGGAYTIAGAFRLAGPLDRSALAGAFADVVARHESLRTIFDAAEGQPYQSIASTGSFFLDAIDLSGRADAEAAVEAYLREDAGRGFDLRIGPLLRACLLALSSEAHVLAIAMHHIVSDGWAVGVLLREVGVFYAARTGAVLSLPPPPRYAEHLLAERDAPERGGLGLPFWRDRLRGAPSESNLPTDFPRPARQSFTGATLRFEIEPTVAEALRALALSEGATLFMTLLAAFQFVIARWSGELDVVVGTPVANRVSREAEGIIGFLVNTLVMRGDLGGDPSFRTLLARTKAASLSAFAHADTPFDLLVDDLQPPRDLSRQPLFQVMFVFQNAPPPVLGLPGIKAVPVRSGMGASAKFDLTLAAEESDRTIACGLEYATDLFSRATVERMASHLATALAALAADPDAPLSRHALMTQDERRAVLAYAAPSCDGVAADQPVHRDIEAAAASGPDRVALVSGERVLTYGELDRRASALAGRLAAAGVGPEVVVAIHAPRSIEAVTGILAVLKAGGAYLPLDVHLPNERLGAVLKHAKPLCVLATAERRDALAAAWNGPVLDLFDRDAEPGAAVCPGIAVDGQSLAYVIYTSGSTGQPKGVMATHRGLANRVAAQAGLYPFRPDDVCCHKTSLAFVDAVFEILGPLSRGLPLVVVGEEEGRDADALSTRLSRHGVTRLIAVPSIAAMLLAATERDRRLDGIRDWTLSGETLDPDLFALLASRFPGAAITNLYGSSEIAADATGHCVEAGDVAKDAAANGACPAPVPIGKPLRNVGAYVLDGSMAPAPIGVAGELYVGGLGTARGYLADARQTAERFVPNPFVSGERLFRTGDVARLRLGGALEFLGRSDRQVKLRGYRIELDEIEASLLAHEAVVAAAVVLRREEATEPHIAAFLLPRRGATLDPATLRRFLRERLPAHMVPARIAIVDALPRTPSGKIDRLAAARLPIPDDVPVQARSATLTEAAVAALWAELLGREEIDVEANFFESGGSSLLAMRMQHLLGTRLGQSVPVAALFQYPTIRSLARYLSGGSAEPAGTPAPKAAIPKDRIAALRARQRDAAVR